MPTLTRLIGYKDRITEQTAVVTMVFTLEKGI